MATNWNLMKIKISDILSICNTTVDILEWTSFCLLLQRKSYNQTHSNLIYRFHGSSWVLHLEIYHEYWINKKPFHLVQKWNLYKKISFSLDKIFKYLCNEIDHLTFMQQEWNSSSSHKMHSYLMFIIINRFIVC